MNRREKDLERSPRSGKKVTLAMKLKYLLPFEFVKADLLLGEFFKTEAEVYLESRKIRRPHRNNVIRRETKREIYCTWTIRSRGSTKQQHS